MEKLEKNPEAVEIFQLEKLTLGQASMLADSIFKDVNVNTIIFTLTNDYQHVVLTDLLHRCKKFLLMYVIQESSDYHLKVTLISRLSYPVMIKQMVRLIDILKKQYKEELNYYI